MSGPFAACQIDCPGPPDLAARLEAVLEVEQVRRGRHRAQRAEDDGLNLPRRHLHKGAADTPETAEVPLLTA